MHQTWRARVEGKARPRMSISKQAKRSVPRIRPLSRRVCAIRKPRSARPAHRKPRIHPQVHHLRSKKARWSVKHGSPSIRRTIRAHPSQCKHHRRRRRLSPYSGRVLPSLHPGSWKVRLLHQQMPSARKPVLPRLGRSHIRRSRPRWMCPARSHISDHHRERKSACHATSGRNRREPPAVAPVGHTRKAVFPIQG